MYSSMNLWVLFLEHENKAPHLYKRFTYDNWDIHMTIYDHGKSKTQDHQNSTDPGLQNTCWAFIQHFN